jgi:RNA-directed DNA polymerase
MGLSGALDSSGFAQRCGSSVPGLTGSSVPWDDFVVMVHGQRGDAEALRDEVSELLAPLGLRLAAEKTRVCPIDEGFDFLGWHIQRRRKRGTGNYYVYTYPSRRSLAAIRDKVRTLTRRTSQPNLRLLLLRVNAALRGWANYFKHGVSKRCFDRLGSFAWRRVVRWLRQRHLGLNWTAIRRRFLNGWQIVYDGITLYNPATVTITRYRYRGARIPSPWSTIADTNARLVESRMR